MKKITFALCSLLFISSLAIAGEWLPNFEDIPQMDNISVIEDESFVYSVPMGKIIQTTITSENVSRRQFQRFYRDALNELGWKNTTDERKLQTFTRDDDELNIEIIYTDPLTARFLMTTK